MHAYLYQSWRNRSVYALSLSLMAEHLPEEHAPWREVAWDASFPVKDLREGDASAFRQHGYSVFRVEPKPEATERSGQIHNMAEGTWIQATACVDE